MDTLLTTAATHYYAWKNNEKRITMHKRHCRILARGKMNSILIEFEDGQREIVSRNSVRLIKQAKLIKPIVEQEVNA